MTTLTAGIAREGLVAGKPADELTLIVGDKAIAGWQVVELTLRAEGFPNNYAITATAGTEELASIVAGVACQVALGGDTVITGYVDRVTGAGGTRDRALRVSGRGRTQDLVDCSAEWPGGVLVGGSVASVCRRIASPARIDLVVADGANANGALPDLAINYGETSADIVQRSARSNGLLAYEDGQGRLVLATVGSRTAGGIAYGLNVERWSVERSMDGRYSEVCCARLSTDAFVELAGNQFFHTERDPSVPRHRRLNIIAEPVGDRDPLEHTIIRAKWEVARRAGRAHVVNVTVDSWRDKAGDLWAPNTVVPVDLPGSKGDLVLSEVTFRRDDRSGTTADLVLMPREAFLPEPLILLPVNLSDVTGPAGT